MSKRLKSFVVMADLKLTCGITINAENLEEAVKLARVLKEEDFVDIKDEYMDGGIEITGVWASHE